LRAEPVVHKYARALFHAAMEKNAAEKITELLQILSRALQISPELSGFLLNPEIPGNKKIDVMKKITGQKEESDKLLPDFLNLLLSRGRLSLLPDMAGAFQELYREAKGEIDLFVMTPFALSKEQKSALIEAIEKFRPGKKICLREEIDKSLLGGLKIEFEGKIYDGTVAGWLKKSEHVLKGE
jgi:F-type H+-transporting ATPase subunit delta